MRFQRCVSGVLVFGFALAAGLPAAAQEAPAATQFKVICGHDCLEQFAERFLYAIGHGDPSAVPLAPHVRYTENGQVLAIGDALWATAQGLGENRLVFTDPVTGGIQLYAGVIESGLPSMLAARLKVENRQITEIETSVLRRNADDPAMATFALDRPIWREVVPPNRRLSRQELIDIADSYFEGITQGRGDVTPFDPQCTRFENGSQMTLRADEGANPVVRMSCQEQFEAGMLVIVTSISHRRYLVVDEEDQVVSAIATFDHRGNLESVPIPRGRTVTPNPAFTRPFSFLIFESFKVIDGRIRQIEATVHSVPYRMHPGWPAP
ncbi:MAG TPA: hypothetical protein VIL43_01875 [Burkholderiales bacterium]